MCKLISFLSREESEFFDNSGNLLLFPRRLINGFFSLRCADIAQEGIFRKTGAVSRQQQLKTCLNEGMAVDFDDNNFSVHDCASVLKNFLAELPEPLVTDAYYPLYCQISGKNCLVIFMFRNRILKGLYWVCSLPYCVEAFWLVGKN